MVKYWAMEDERSEVINTNKTSIIISLIYIVIAYVILRFIVSNEVSLGIYTILPLGVIIIVILFNHVFKYDFFENNKGE